jgi:hypothetical protein
METGKTSSRADIIKEQPYPRRKRPKNAKTFTEDMFAINEIEPRPDSRLSDLLADTSIYLEDAELSRFLKAQKRFDGPVTMGETGEKIEHYKLRSCLKELPEYLTEAEKSGLSYQQTLEILIHTLETDRFEFSDVDIYIVLLTRTFKIAGQSGINLSRDFDALKDLITFGGKSWGPEMAPSLYMLSIALRLGLSVEQACKIFRKIDDIGAPATDYVTPHFNNALKSMLPAKVEPALVEEAFGLIGDNNGYYSGLYDLFRTLMTFGGPAQGMTPNELLTHFITRIKTGETSEQKQNTAEVPKEKYFLENESEVLEHAALPYRKIKSLNAGIKDLEKLALAKSQRWEEAGEGMWTFDPESETWYSLGGQLETPSMEDVFAGKADRIRHNFLPYDLSRLSEAPYLFHVHPEAYESLIAPPRESLVYPELRNDITKFLTATPSGADYGTVGNLLKGSGKPVPTQSFIAHALGITEFSYPDDPAKLDQMKEQSRNIRDQVLLEFDITGYLKKHGWPVNRLHLVQSMIRALNKKLPEGFGISLYPTGTDFENIRAVTDVQDDTRGNVNEQLEEQGI